MSYHARAGYLYALSAAFHHRGEEHRHRRRVARARNSRSTLIQELTGKFLYQAMGGSHSAGDWFLHLDHAAF